MKESIISNYILSHQQSIYCFVDILSKVHDVQMMLPLATLFKSGHSELRLNKWLGYIDRFFMFGWQLKQAANLADIVHICGHSNAMYSNSINKFSSVTCHDLLYVQSDLRFIETNKTEFTRRVLQKSIISELQAFTHVACVFKITLNKLFKTLNNPVEQTSTSYNVPNYLYSPISLNEPWSVLKKQLFDLKPSYFFHLSENQQYISGNCATEIYSELILHPEFKDHNLVLVGKSWRDYLKDKVSVPRIKN
jgi:hypothetical protein